MPEITEKELERYQNFEHEAKRKKELADEWRDKYNTIKSQNDDLEKDLRASRMDSVDKVSDIQTELDKNKASALRYRLMHEHSVPVELSSLITENEEEKIVGQIEAVTKLGQIPPTIPSPGVRGQSVGKGTKPGQTSTSQEMKAAWEAQRQGKLGTKTSVDE